VHDNERIVNSEGDLVKELKMDANSGMAGVVPTWKLNALLMSEQLVNERNTADTKLTDQLAAQSSST
jgi:hypothetical protein